jgi:K+-sensing histidine kinase KdpD
MTTVTSDISGSIDVGAPNRQAGARRFRKVFVRHAYAVLFVSLALMLTITLANKLGKTISPFFFVAVMFSAWFGLGPGLVATFLAAFFSAFYFMDPPGSLRVGVDDVVRLIMFLVAAIMISSMTALQRNTEAQLKLAQRDLEQRVRERTAELRATNERSSRKSTSAAASKLSCAFPRSGSGCLSRG